MRTRRSFSEGGCWRRLGRRLRGERWGDTSLQLNDLFANEKISLDDVLVMRHRPTEPALRKVLPWLAAERPEIFNAYQQTQSERAERALAKAKYLASFIGHEAGKAIFVGLYRVGKITPLNYGQYWKVPAYKKMKLMGHRGFTGNRPKILWFDLKLLPFYSDWKGKLVIRWPSPERAWFRWARRNRFPVDAILNESCFSRGMPDWSEISLTWDELKIIPSSWRDRLKEWRGVYLIYDAHEQKGYVGSAYGHENILGRWTNYLAQGHGGNKLLRKSQPKNLRFSILQRVSPDLAADEVVRFENSWKIRLLTREFGLNKN